MGLSGTPFVLNGVDKPDEAPSLSLGLSSSNTTSASQPDAAGLPVSLPSTV